MYTWLIVYLVFHVALGLLSWGWFLYSTEKISSGRAADYPFLALLCGLIHILGGSISMLITLLEHFTGDAPLQKGLKFF